MSDPLRIQLQYHFYLLDLNDQKVVEEWTDDKLNFISAVEKASKYAESTGHRCSISQNMVFVAPNPK